jgi:hypothetical protein
MRCGFNSSREGYDLGHHDGKSDRGVGSGATRLKGPDGNYDEKAKGEEGQDGTNGEEGVKLFCEALSSPLV